MIKEENKNLRNKLEEFEKLNKEFEKENKELKNKISSSLDASASNANSSDKGKEKFILVNLPFFIFNF